MQPPHLGGGTTGTSPDSGILKFKKKMEQLSECYRAYLFSYSTW